MKEFTVKDLGINYRLVNHWDGEGLFFTQNEDQKWRKYNFIEFVWTQIVKNLREFGVPFDIIRKVKSSLVEEIPYQDFITDISSENTQQVVRDSPFYKGDFEQGYNDLINSPKEKIEAGEELLKDKNLINPLFFMICGFIALRGTASLLINLKGKVLFYHKDYYENIAYSDELPNDFLSDSYVSISLNKILKEFVINSDDKKSLQPINILTEDEMEVINLIRKKSLIELKLIFDDKKDIKLIEATERKKIDAEARLMDVIISGGYQNIQFKTQNGKIVEFTNTKKIKLK